MQKMQGKKAALLASPRPILFVYSIVTGAIHELPYFSSEFTNTFSSKLIQKEPELAPQRPKQPQKEHFKRNSFQKTIETETIVGK